MARQGLTEYAPVIQNLDFTLSVNCIMNVTVTPQVKIVPVLLFSIQKTKQAGEVIYKKENVNVCSTFVFKTVKRFIEQIIFSKRQKNVGC